MKKNKTNINLYPGHIAGNSDTDTEFKDYLLKVREELNIIAERNKQFDEERNRILELARKPSTVTRLKSMKENS